MGHAAWGMRGRLSLRRALVNREASSHASCPMPHASCLMPHSSYLMPVYNESAMSLTPTITRHVLPSGLTILVETLPYVRSVALGFYLRSGSAVESEEHGGASHFLEHLVFKGTKRRSTSDIAQIIDILGGDVDAFTGKEYTSFYAHVLDEQVDTALDLLTDLVVAPRFTEADLESERSVILEEIKMVEDTPDDLVHEIFVTAFWPDHPLGRPILGTADTVTRLGRDQILAHYAETFHPA